MTIRATYDDDFFNWTQEQAALLRDLPRDSRLPNAIDVAHIAEEIEDMGKSELARVRSNILQLMIHLIKLAGHGLDAEPSHHWLDEDLAFRIRASAHFSPSMRQQIDMQDVWDEALARVLDALAVYGETMPDVPDVCPLQLDNIIGRKTDLKAMLAAIDGKNAS
jgi:hypothetical protein